MSSPLGIVAIVLALLIAVAFATYEEPVSSPSVAPLKEIARRVEVLRGVGFRSVPDPVTVTPAQAKREGLADLDKGYPAARRRVDEALYVTLGLLPEGTDLREISAATFGEQVAGYYDPRNGRLRIVSGAAGTGNRVVDEMVLAHELTHALEDQAFGFSLQELEASDDTGYARRALVEGTATALMYRYVERFFRGEEALGGLLSSAFGVTSTTPLPRFVMEGLTFPYIEGEAFVQSLLERAGGTWRLVDVALKARPPLSTEQVLHPEKWLRVEVPVRVALRGVGEALGPGWSRASAGVFGEWQTAQLIAEGGPRVPEASEGWGGDRYELWRRGSETVVVVRWAWDTEDDSNEFALAVRRALAESVEVPFALSRSGRVTTLVAGPDAARVLRSLPPVDLADLHP
jgi:hypothetical protein